MAKPLHNEMQSAKLTAGSAGPPTSRYLDIAEIRDDVVIMKDGTLRVVLLASSINFALKSEDEQEAVIQSYMQFLNSLEYPIQIVVQSRRMNIDPYLMRLREMQRTQQNQLLRAQIDDYVSYIQELVTMGDIMSKKFYVVVPYNPMSDKRKSFFERLTEAFQPVTILKLQEKAFYDRKVLLQTRAGHVQSGLSSMGVQSVQLDTQSLIELYYNAYNPSEAETQKLANIDSLQIDRL